MLNKKTLTIIAIIIVVLFIALYIAYRSGKFSSTNTKPPKTGDLTPEEVAILEALSQKLYEDMSGLNRTWNHNLYEQVSLLDDEELVVLSNIFNSKFEKESGETFFEWLDSENFSWDSFSLETVTDTIKNRLINLGAV